MKISQVLTSKIISSFACIFSFSHLSLLIYVVCPCFHLSMDYFHMQKKVIMHWYFPLHPYFIVLLLYIFIKNFNVLKLSSLCVPNFFSIFHSLFHDIQPVSLSLYTFVNLHSFPFFLSFFLLFPVFYFFSLC